MTVHSPSTLDAAKLRKVHGLMMGGATEGERSAARARAEAMAAKAGMSLKDALSSLDAKPQAAPASFFDGFDDWCEKREPGYKAKKAAEAFVRRSREDRRRAEILNQYGSEQALFARTEREVLLEEAIAPLVTKWDFWADDEGTRFRMAEVIDGKPASGTWYFEDVTPAIRDAVMGAFAWPSKLDAALREMKIWDQLRRDRALFTSSGEWNHYVEVECRLALLEHALKAQPAASWDDVEARFAWKRYDELRGWIYPEEHEDERDPFLDQLEADFAFLRKQAAPEPSEPAPAAPRTTAEKRAAVLSMLDTHSELSDREIARQIGVSPQTVNNWRKRRCP